LFRKNTVFVIVAGASAEYELPVGNELASTIASLMKFDDPSGQQNKGGNYIINVVRNQTNHDTNTLLEYIDAAKRISEGIPHTDSIDQYLDNHENDEKAKFLGKAAIVWAILESEKNSTLFYDSSSNPRTINFDDLNDHWLKPFFTKLIARRRKQNLDEISQGITLICFNYDRCIEHYLIHALQKAYSITSQEAARLVNMLEIYHPYGKVGKLKTESNMSGVGFGEELSIDRLVQSVERIRTYSEQVEDESGLAQIKKVISDADAIVFLGFPYRPQNMEILKPTGTRGDAKSIFGTAFGISDFGKKKVEELLVIFAPILIPKIEVNNSLKCSQFLQHYEMGL
jgi:hypothetical protein